MILHLADLAYFGHFNFETLRSMRNLRILELRVVDDVGPNWDREDYMIDLMREFKEEEERHPEWAMPLIKIVKKPSSEIVMVARLGREET